MSLAATAWIVCANAEEAERIARTLVEERLAACCNIMAPCRSVYRWDGVIEEADEVPVLAKTVMERTDALIARVKGLHSYETPAITVWPIAELPEDYARWIEENCAPDRFA